jgi:hypothetical protein
MVLFFQGILDLKNEAIKTTNKKRKLTDDEVFPR